MATTKEDFLRIKKMIKHEIHKRQKENKLKEISKDNELNEEYNISLLKNTEKKIKKKKKKQKSKPSAKNEISSLLTTYHYNKLKGNTSIQSTIVSPKKEVYIKTCDDNDKYLNKEKTGSTNSNKEEFTIPVVNTTEVKELILLKKKKGDKKKVQNNYLKNEKAILKTEQNHQTLNEETKLLTFGLNERTKKVHKPNKDTKIISINEEDLTRMREKNEIKNKKNEVKNPKVQNINDFEDNNAGVHTKKIHNIQTNKLLSDFIEPKKEFYNDLTTNSMDTDNVDVILKSPLKETKENENKSKVPIKEETELSKKATKYNNLNKKEYLKNIKSEDNSKEIHKGTAVINSPYISRISNVVKDCEQPKKYDCSICGRTFKRHDNFLVHYKTHTGEKPHVCKVCNKEFVQKTNLKNHERIHSGEKPFKCNICERLFSLKSTLNKHNRIHTKEKPYVCDVCGQSFSQRGNLAVHNRQHTGERPYQCGMCGKSFLSSSHLTKHERSIHEK